MTGKTVLITGASGEIGHSLIEHYTVHSDASVIAFDLKAPGASAVGHATPSPTHEKVKFVQGDITDKSAIDKLFADHEFDVVFHLAAILSTGGERNPLLAHRVNVEGTLNLLTALHEQTQKSEKKKLFIFPSTIAAFGTSSPAEKYALGRLKENDAQNPITMYGVNKRYVEQLGTYFTNGIGRFAEGVRHIDFRAVRFPGILSSDTLPTGGTSDYGSEMIHAAASGKPYDCFVSAETQLPFMAMADAVRCLVELAEAPAEKLTQRVYNVGAFAITAEEIRSFTLNAFPGAELGYKIDPRRHEIVESWPADVDDSAAQRDWGWKARYGKEATFNEYLIPRIRARYQKAAPQAVNALG